jgi:hypothetical protein
MHAVKEDPDAQPAPVQTGAACAMCKASPKPFNRSYCDPCAAFRTALTDLIRSLIRAHGRVRGTNALADAIKTHMASLGVHIGTPKAAKRSLAEMNDQSNAAAAQPAEAAQAAPHVCALSSLKDAVVVETKLRATRRDVVSRLDVKTLLRDECSAYLERLRALYASNASADVQDVVSKTEAELAAKEAARAAEAAVLEATAPDDAVAAATKASDDRWGDVAKLLEEYKAYLAGVRAA